VQVSSPYFQKQRNWFANFLLFCLSLCQTLQILFFHGHCIPVILLFYTNNKLLRVFSKHWFSLHNYSLNLMIWQMLPCTKVSNNMYTVKKKKKQKKTNYLFWYMFSLIRHSILIRNVSKIVNNNKPNLSVSFHHIKLKSLIQNFWMRDLLFFVSHLSFWIYQNFDDYTAAHV
jgi:hypothetical protein